MIDVACWLRHTRNKNKTNCTSYEYTTNFWSHLPLSFLNPSLQPHFSHCKQLPKPSRDSPQTTPIFHPKPPPPFAQAAPALKPAFHPIEKKKKTLNSYNCCMHDLNEHIKVSHLATFQCSLKSNPTFAQNQPCIFPQSPNFLPETASVVHQRDIRTI